MWLQAMASTTNDDGCQLVEEEEGSWKQGKQRSRRERQQQRRERLTAWLQAVEAWRRRCWAGAMEKRAWLAAMREVWQHDDGICSECWLGLR
ncbi:hypothetical protein GW17_00048540 [Ensete ventricosum]|nr:hypothetical protein GW17_00048540 [Ensete ventricosum]